MSASAATHTRRSALLTVERVVRETDDAVTIVFERPNDARFQHRAGQFLTLRVPSERTGSVARCYSLCSTPHDRNLAVTIKRTAEGYVSNWLCDNVRPGCTIEALPPSGAFSPASPDDDLLLVGGGSGITPLLSIARTCLEAGSAHVTLLYANRDERSVIFAAQLSDLVQAYPGRFAVIHWLASVQGIPSVSSLSSLLAPYVGRATFVCGPEPFMDAARAALVALGVDRELVRTERFLSLSGDPFEDPEIEPEAAAAAAADEHPAYLTVSLDGATHELSWPHSLTLIDLLTSQNIEAPYSCREGECGSCICTLVSGNVRMDRTDTLAPEDIAEGYILGCQSHPVSESVVIEF